MQKKTSGLSHPLTSIARVGSASGHARIITIITLALRETDRVEEIRAETGYRD